MNCSMGCGLNPEYLATKLSEPAEQLTTFSPEAPLPLLSAAPMSDAIIVCVSD